jgi:hypothetical protein
MNNSVLAKLAVVISAQNAEFNRAMAQSHNTFKGFATSVKTLGASLGITFGAAAIFSGLRYGVGVVMDFQKTMSEVRAITNATNQEFNDLSKNALALGRSSLYTAQQVATLQIAYGRLGFSSAEIMKVTKATLQLATATGEDLAKSSDIAGSTMRSFNLDASEMQRVIDIMAASFNKSALGLDNFGEAMKYVAPVAAAANISLEETTAMLGVLADSGIRGSMAGTSLRKIISDVGKESGTLTERLQKLSEKELTGAEAMDEVGRTAYASLLILTKHIDKVNEATVAYSNAAGEAQKMADIMSDNLSGDVVKLQNAFDGLILAESGSTGVMRDFTQALTSFLDTMSDSDSAFGTFLDGFAALIALPYRGLASAWRELAGIWKDTPTGATGTWNEGGVTGTWEPDKKKNDAPAKVITTINSLQEAYKKLGEQYEDTALKFNNGKITADQSELRRIAAQIASYDNLIDKLQKLKQFYSDIGNTLISLKDRGKNDPFGLDPKVFERFEEGLKQLAVKTKQSTTEIATAFLDLRPMITNAVIGIAEAFGSAIAGVGNFGESMLRVLLGFARQVGETLIALGVGMLAAQVAIKNPYAAIAAGIALVALSSAGMAGISRAQSGFNSGSGGGSSSQSSQRYSPAYLSGDFIQVGGTIEVNGDRMLVLIENAKAKQGSRRG